MLTSQQCARYLFLLFTTIYLLFSAFTIIPGYVLNDEAIYHLMVRNVAETGGFEIWNGYQEFPSPELVPTFTSVHKQRLVAQYPYLYPFLCLPYYRLWGYRGMLWLNVCALPGIVFFCYATAQKLFHDRRLALNACCFLIFATFIYEYTQASLPHVTTTLFLMSAFFLFVRRLRCAPVNNPGTQHYLDSHTFYSHSFCAGFLIGLAMGIRLDACFFLPALALPLMFLRPWRPKPALAVCVGASPGIVLLSITNAIKFGKFSFLSYGYGGLMLAWHLSFVWWSATALVVAWILTRRPVLVRLRQFLPQMIILVIAGTIGVLFMFPQFGVSIGNRANAICQLVIDFRIRHAQNIGEFIRFFQHPGMLIESMEGLKKSLLQSCPYLVVLIVPLLHIVRRNREWFPLSLLFSVPFVFISFYAYYAWHGGESLNLRYVVPIFPFTSILAAHAWRELTHSLHWRWEWIALAVCLISGIFYFIFFRPCFQALEQQEFLYLTLPLILAFLLAFSLSLRFFRSLSHFAVVLFIVAICWSGLVEFLYDYPRVRQVRQRTFDIATQTTALFADDAILFSPEPFPFFRLITRDRMRVANPELDDFSSFPALLTFHLNQGRAVYGAFSPEQWSMFKKSSMLDPMRYKVIPLGYFSGIVGEIRRQEADTQADDETYYPDPLL